MRATPGTAGRLAGWVLLVATGGGLLVACGGEDERVGAVADGGALEAQRTQVREAAATLAREGAEALGGRAAAATGRFEGCESADERSYRTYRYVASARLEAGADRARPYLDGLDPVLAEAGFAGATGGERPGGRTLTASSGDLTATLSELPDAGDHVLLSVEGPCLEVPEAERDAWSRRTDPESYL